MLRAEATYVSELVGQTSAVLSVHLVLADANSLTASLQYPPPLAFQSREQPRREPRGVRCTAAPDHTTAAADLHAISTPLLRLELRPGREAGRRCGRYVGSATRLQCLWIPIRWLGRAQMAPAALRRAAAAWAVAQRAGPGHRRRIHVM